MGCDRVGLQTLLQTLGLSEAGHIMGCDRVCLQTLLQTLGLSEAGHILGCDRVCIQTLLQTLGLSEAGHILGCDRVCIQTLVATNVEPLRGLHSNRVMRGRNWNNTDKFVGTANCRTANRNNNIGFRLVFVP